MTDFTPDGITTGTPTLDSPTFGQTHVLCGLGITTGVPTLGSPEATAERFVWPFAPRIWSDRPYTVAREYRTSVWKSRAGKEQRRAMRQTPRKRVDFTAPQTEACLRRFDREMVSAQRRRLIIHDRVRFATLASEMPIGDVAVVVAVPGWLTVGQSVVLGSAGVYGHRVVRSIVGTTVSFTGAGTTTWPAGTRLYAALDGYLETNIAAPLVWQSAVADVSFIFKIDPGSEISEDVGIAAATLSGREIFIVPPSRFDPITLGRVQEGAAEADYGFGRIQNFFPIEFSTRMWEAAYRGCSFNGTEVIRKFFDRMKGRAGEFYMPTFQADLIPAAALTSAGVTITVAGVETDDVYDGDTVYSAIAVKKVDGTWLYRAVDSMTTAGGDTVITVSTAWGENVAQDSIAMVCWMPVWRFSSDIMTTTWPREHSAEMRLPFQMLERLAVET